ncbi:MAG: hypothetical protein EBV03_10665, partial [Proteobacteria bacterium]|nr:hypothetical protein [Pseudomonadota bacterium]
MMLGNRAIKQEQLSHYAFIAACIYAFFRIFSYAWVSDDAYITFRVVDNAVNGYGLRWNIDERVQGYTNPLWMFLHIPFYYFYRNIFQITIALGAVFGALGVAALLRSAPAGPWHKIVLVLVPLCFSAAYCDHIIDGLEAPVTLLLLALFWGEMVKPQPRHYRLLLLASLAFFNRMDTVVVLSPGLVWLAWQLRPPRINLLRAAAATAPAWGWLAFSLLYYGFPFPNTKYAKLHTGLAQWEYTRQGIAYQINYYYFDRFGYLFLRSALLASLYPLGLWLGRPYLARMPALPQLPPAIPAHVVPLMMMGVLLHLCYVRRVGGDFMAGRFYVAPFLVALQALYFALHRVSPLLLVVLAAFFFNMHQIQVQYDRTHGYRATDDIYDERWFYESRQALFRQGTFWRVFLQGKLFNAKGIANVLRDNVAEGRHIPRAWVLPPDFNTRKLSLI